MADKRMFSKSIVLSDAFLDMPATSRCLYFTLNMVADDDGFVDAPKAIMRQCGAQEDDLKILFAKSFVIPFDSGIIVIKHWRINNYLRNDRYKETKYLAEKSELTITENGSYTKEAKPKLIEREPKNDLEVVEKKYLELYSKLYESRCVQTEKPIINWSASRKLTKTMIEKYGLENVLKVVENAYTDNFCISKGFVLTTIMSSGVFAGLINRQGKHGIVNERFEAETIQF